MAGFGHPADLVALLDLQGVGGVVAALAVGVLAGVRRAGRRACRRCSVGAQRVVRLAVTVLVGAGFVAGARVAESGSGARVRLDPFAAELLQRVGRLLLRRFRGVLGRGLAVIAGARPNPPPKPEPEPPEPEPPPKPSPPPRPLTRAKPVAGAGAGLGLDPRAAELLQRVGGLLLGLFGGRGRGVLTTGRRRRHRRRRSVIRAGTGARTSAGAGPRAAAQPCAAAEAGAPAPTSVERAQRCRSLLLGRFRGLRGLLLRRLRGGLLVAARRTGATPGRARPAAGSTGTRRRVRVRDRRHGAATSGTRATGTRPGARTRAGTTAGHAGTRATAGPRATARDA